MTIKKKKSTKIPQDSGECKVGYKKPPQTEASKKTRYGGEKENQRGHGFWKKEDTARYKLERMMKLNSVELRRIAEDANEPLFDRRMARCIKDGKWREIESMINQVYGFPKQAVETIDLTPPPPLSPRKRKKNKR